MHHISPLLLAPPYNLRHRARVVIVTVITVTVGVIVAGGAGVAGAAAAATSTLLAFPRSSYCLVKESRLLSQPGIGTPDARALVEGTLFAL